MVISVGEILCDMIGSSEGGGITYKRFAGGAPFNVTCNIANMGGKVGFVGRVGDDLIGKFLQEYAAKIQLDYLELEVDKDRNTTLAFVENGEDGERSFCFYRKNTADFMIQSDFECFKKANIVHVGSLGLNESEGRKFIFRAMNKAKDLGKKISFDTNFREDLFDKNNLSVFNECFEYADIIKLSEDELQLLTGKCDLQSAAEKLDGGKLYAISLGKKGSAIYNNGELIRINTISVKPIDTTGAGDAFYSTILKGIDEGVKDLPRLFATANVVGALSTLKKGAIVIPPENKEINSYVERILKN